VTPTRTRTLALVAAAAAAALVLAGCGSSGDSSSAAATTAGASSSGSSALDGDITVLAAASLTSTFTEIGARFESANPGVKVTFSFAGSSDLVTQIAQGAPGDVFASADTTNMTKVTTAGDNRGDPVRFATNVLEIATPPGNPAGITSFADLAKPGVQVVVCAPQVPCGAAAKKVEDTTGTAITPVSEEQSVTDVLGKVVSGEADAGLVYVTDVTTAGDKVTGVEFPESANAVNTYPIVALKSAASPGTAAAFAAFVAGPEGQEVLTAAGFGAP
jgi:molybdate transport system substrate-binding protein